MDALKSYLRGLPDEEARVEFATKCETTLDHLRNVMYGLRPAAPELCVLLEQVSGRKVRRQDMRPGDFERIWPELAPSRKARKVAL